MQSRPSRTENIQRMEALRRKFVLKCILVVCIAWGLIFLSIFLFGTKEEEPLSNETPQVNIKHLKEEREQLLGELNVIYQTHFDEALYQMEEPNPAPDTAILQISEGKKALKEWKKKWSEHIVLEEGYSEASQDKYLMIANDYTNTMDEIFRLFSYINQNIKDGKTYPLYIQDAVSSAKTPSYGDMKDILKLKAMAFDDFDDAFPTNNF